MCCSIGGGDKVKNGGTKMGTNHAYGIGRSYGRFTANPELSFKNAVIILYIIILFCQIY